MAPHLHLPSNHPPQDPLIRGEILDQYLPMPSLGDEGKQRRYSASANSVVPGS